MTFISESMYWHGKGRICNCLNRLLHGVVGCVPAIILTTFFCKVKILRLLEETIILCTFSTKINPSPTNLELKMRLKEWKDAPSPKGISY
jgi:hypothetical protein